MLFFCCLHRKITQKPYLNWETYAGELRILSLSTTPLLFKEMSCIAVTNAIWTEGEQFQTC